MKVTIDVQRRGKRENKWFGSMPLPLVRFDAYENQDPKQLDPDIQHTLAVLLEDPNVQGVQITIEK